MNYKYDIVGLGEILIDFIPDGKDSDGDARFIKKAGGAPMNLLATASKFGKNTAFIGKVGNDMFGSFLKNTLSEYNISNSGLVTDNLHNTTLAFVELDENGDRDFSFYRNFGADTFLSKNEIDVDLVKNTNIFHFGSLSSTSEISKTATQYAVKFAKENGAVISYDPNYREPLWGTQDDAVSVMKNDLRYVDIVKLSLEEAVMITGKSDAKSAIYDISNIGTKIILVTDGGNGVNFFYNGEFGFLPSLQVKPVDTTGAGDIFFGTFLSEFIDYNKSIVDFSFDDVKKCVETAIKFSGLSTLKHGGVASIPDKSMIY